MATAEQMKRSITPGSLPYGERQAFEQALSTPTSPPQAASMAAGAAVPGMPTNPLDLLASGDVPVANDPTTAGLSVGSGPGPAAAAAPAPDSKMVRLRLLATQAKSPVLRGLARRALRGAAMERRRGF